MTVPISTVLYFLSHPLPSLDYYAMTNLMILSSTGDQDCKLTQIRALRCHSPDYFLYSKGWNISEITYQLSKYARKSCAYNKVRNMLPGNTH